MSGGTDGARVAIGVDVGGSGIKAALVDIDTGALIGQRLRVPTPEPSAPGPVAEAIAGLIRDLGRQDGAAARLPKRRRSGRGKDDRDVSGSEATAAFADAPVGVGLPAPVIAGVTRTAANVDGGWIGYAAEIELGRRLGRPVVAGNDADVAGLAEMRFGAGRGVAGTVLVLTVGTGIGSALFVDGCLVPNTELGHLELRGKDAERRASDAARQRRRLSWDEWGQVFDEYLHLVQRLFWPDLFILGGGVSKRTERFLPKITVDVPVVPAQLRNDAGMVGAAVTAWERTAS